MSSETFSSLMAVCKHLKASGFRVSKSTVYNHYDEGKIKADKTGKFTLQVVEKYAASYLKRLDGTSGQSKAIDDLQLAKASDESRRLKAIADIAELKAKVMSGEFVPKDIFEQNLAARAALFRSDLENMVAGESPSIITLVAGDENKLPDLVEFLRDKIEIMLARYSEERVFEVVIPLPSFDTDLEDLEEDAASEGSPAQDAAE